MLNFIDEGVHYLAAGLARWLRPLSVAYTVRVGRSAAILLLLSVGLLGAGPAPAPGIDSAKGRNLGDSTVTMSVAGEFPGVRGVTAMEVSNGRAYVLDASSLSVFDISQPKNPVLLGRTSITGGVLALGQGIALVATGNAVRIFDVQNPSSIQLLGALEIHIRSMGFPGSPLAIGGIALEGNLAYLGATGGSFELLDLSNPRSPVRVASFPNWAGDGVVYSAGGDGEPISASGDYCYVGWSKYPLRSSLSRQYGVAVLPRSGYTLGTPGPFPLAIYSTVLPGSSPDQDGRTRQLWWRDGYLVLAASDMGLQIVDVRNPLSPSRVSYYFPGGKALDVRLAGDSAYLAAGVGGLQVLDLRNLSVPQVRGLLALGGSVSLVRVLDDVVYASGPDLGLKIVQVASESSQPVAQTITWDLPSEVNDILRLRLAATSSSGLPVSFTLVRSEVAGISIANDMVEISPGTQGLAPVLHFEPFIMPMPGTPRHLRPNYGPWAVLIRASQPGNGRYLPAEVQKTLLVSYATRIGIQSIPSNPNRVLVQLPSGEVEQRGVGGFGQIQGSYWSLWNPNYRIQFSTNMVSWSDLSGPHAAGSAPVSVSLPSGRAFGFLRLIKVP